MDNNFTAMGTRLKLERERLGLKQTDLINLVDVSIPALSTYENGKRFPNLELLAALHAIGYDIHYVITGEYANTGIADFSKEETEWLEIYRQLDNDDRERLIKMAKSLL